MSLFWLLLLFGHYLFGASTVIAEILTEFNTSTSINSSSANLQAQTDLNDFDARFTVDVDLRDESLNATSSAMNLLACIRGLAYVGTWRDFVDEARFFRKAPWRNTVVVAMPTPERSPSALQQRVAIWGAYIALCRQIAANEAWTAIFTLKWLNVPVGLVLVSRPMDDDLGDGLGLSWPLNITTAASIDAPVNVTSSNGNETDVTDVGDTSSVTVSVMYLDRASPIQAQQIYGLIGKAMTEAAERPKGILAQSGLIDKAGYSNELEIIARGTARAGSNVLTNARLIEALWQTAKWLTKNGMQKEFMATVKINGYNSGMIVGYGHRRTSSGEAALPSAVFETS